MKLTERTSTLLTYIAIFLFALGALFTMGFAPYLESQYEDSSTVLLIGIIIGFAAAIIAIIVATADIKPNNTA